MGTRIRGRWLSTLLIAAAPVIAAASCGGAGNNSASRRENSDASEPTTDDSGPSVFGSSDAGSSTACVPKTCAQLAYTAA